MLGKLPGNLFIATHFNGVQAMTRICLIAPRLLRSLSVARVMSTENSPSLEQGYSSPASDPFSLSREPMEGESLVYAALRVLYEPNAARKGVLTHQTAELWRAGKLSLQDDTLLNMPPVLSRPARDDTVMIQSLACPEAQESLSMSCAGRKSVRLA